ncbi:hypothetical protein CcrC1_gp326 [Caulobacter phage C1]|nr:hypothetical protein CcrC1_gp326 [Caulobacter phage C1]UTU08555.1 hypothetical protein CcrC2_gp327 [Caulobacter phage C2]UTU09071.1 hypothetical protein CcrJ4_gp322 [Caulobacter phage J4]UTU09630.1 hypothetical protein CcrBL47_gp344 [Caulobacter phage BL47]UTU10188.1 hypothetical protein CcrRB23_gp326 [Caulobacter phage RB23]WGN97222.1 hypothetical protein [Bertelyvirus sp.]
MAQSENVSVVLVVYALYETDRAIAVNAGQLQMQRDNPAALAYLPKSQIKLGAPLKVHEDKVRSRGIPTSVAERLGISKVGYYAVDADRNAVMSRVEWRPVTMPKWLADKHGWEDQDIETMIGVCKTWAYADVSAADVRAALAKDVAHA